MFKEFFRIYFFIKNHKRVVFSRKTRGTDVAHDEHVMRPRERTWMPAWRLRGVCSNGMADDVPTGQWAQVRLLGRTRPMWVTQKLKGLQHYILDIFLLFCPCETNVLIFSRRGIVWRVGCDRNDGDALIS